MVVAISLWLADGDEWAAKADLAGEALVTYGPPVEDCLSELGGAVTTGQRQRGRAGP